MSPVFAKVEPLGVVACIGSFNFPLTTLTFKVASALAIGDVVIIKAPSDASLSLRDHSPG